MLENTISKLIQLKFMILNANRINEIVKYSDDTIKLIIVNKGDKELLIKLIDGLIDSLRVIEPLISKGLKCDHNLIEDKGYLIMIEFIGE